METDTSRSKASESGDGQASRGGQGEGAVGTRRKLSEDQEREVRKQLKKLGYVPNMS